jgi:hypothetical protein
MTYLTLVGAFDWGALEPVTIRGSFPREAPSLEIADCAARSRASSSSSSSSCVCVCVCVYVCVCV